MVETEIEIGKEEKDALIEIALSSSANTKKRKRMTPICIVLGVILVFFGFCVIVSDPDCLDWLLYFILGAFMLALGIGARGFQKFALNLAMKKSNKKLNGDLKREYSFDDEGVQIKSDLGNGKSYWKAFTVWGTYKHYYYLRRVDRQMVLVDANKLTTDERAELNTYFQKIK